MTDTSNAAPAQTPNASVPSADTQPQSTPAPDASAAPGSQPAPAQGTTATPGSSNEPTGFSFESALDDAGKNYLKSQGIESFDQSGLTKLIDAHKSLREKKETPQAPAANAVADALAQATGQKPAAPAAPAEQPPVQQPAPVAQQPAQQPAQPTQNPVQALPNQVEIYNMTNNLVSQFPEIADSIKSGEIYKDMSKLGISPVTDGHFNLEAVLTFAGQANENASLKAQIEQLKKPSTEEIPTAQSRPVDTTAPTVQTMDMNSAQVIVMESNKAMRFGQPVHPQYDQAVKFLQNGK